MSFKDPHEGWDVVDAATNTRRLAKVKRPIEIEIKDIVLGNGGRALDFPKVKQFEKSIADQGFLQPIHVYKLRRPHKGKYGLAAGQHRLRALLNLGYANVTAIVISRRQARAWSSSENLHRNELRALQRSQAIVRYAKQRMFLRRVKANDPPRGGRQPRDRGYKKLAKATGFDRKRIAEAYLHCALSSRVKKLIQGNLNTRRTLNKLARMKNERKQLAYINSRLIAPSNVQKNGNRENLTSNGWGGSPLKALEAAWKSSKIRKLFDKQPKSVRKKFVKRLLS
jgi:ParB family transcriptional regulator, chromosome partitioning protein